MLLARKLWSYAAALLARTQGLAPYAVMVLLVPGGVLMAPLLWLHRRQRKTPAYLR